MTVTFRCGHRQTHLKAAAAAPVCATCGERVVARVSGAAPTFRGACRGPYAVPEGVEPYAERLPGVRPLALKAQE